MSASNLKRAELHVAQLRKKGPVGVQAVEDFLKGRALEPALDSIPGSALQAFLSELLAKLKTA